MMRSGSWGAAVVTGMAARCCFCCAGYSSTHIQPTSTTSTQLRIASPKSLTWLACSSMFILGSKSQKGERTNQQTNYRLQLFAGGCEVGPDVGSRRVVVMVVTVLELVTPWSCVTHWSHQHSVTTHMALH